MNILITYCITAVLVFVLLEVLAYVDCERGNQMFTVPILHPNHRENFIAAAIFPISALIIVIHIITNLILHRRYK